MNTAERIRTEFPSMTRSERSVAEFVLDHMNDILFFTLDELARQVQVSTTSVLRFCRRLGFDGFKQFQQTVRNEMKHSPDLLDKFHRTTAGDGLLEQTVQQGICCIRETFRDLPFAAVTEAVERLAKARRVYTFGMRESQALAMYACSRLLTVRPDVSVYQDGYCGNVEALLGITEEDVFLVYLFHRYTRHTLQLLDVLKQRGVQVVLVTSPPVETVARFATVLLPCKVDVGGIKNSSLAPICLADYLCNAVAMVDMEKTRQRMAESEELFRSNALLDN